MPRFIDIKGVNEPLPKYGNERMTCLSHTAFKSGVFEMMTYLSHTAFESGVFEMMELVENEKALKGLVAHDKLLIEGSGISGALVSDNQRLQCLRVVNVAI